MLKRKYPSGAEKRKAKKQQQESIKKLPTVTNFFKRPNPESEEKLDVVDTSKTDALHQNDTESLPENFLNNTRFDEDLFNDNDGSRKDALSNNFNTDVHKDPALWPLKLYENGYERQKYLEKGYAYFQNKESNFKSSKREYNKQNRYFSPTYFQRTLKNGEMCERKWLMYSELKGSIFCFVCKLFSDGDNSFIKEGFSNWKKIDELIHSHENSKEHNNCMMTYIEYFKRDTNIEASIIKTMESEVQYWTKVLKRVVAGIRFLTERGLPLRGKNEVIGSPNNGNFLGVMELIAEFDPFMQEHIKLYSQKGRGTVSYLSKTIYEEFMELMAIKVLNQIINEMQSAKYWAIIVDSTPDVSHVDQLSVIFRYYLNRHVYERFFTFVKIQSHTGRSLSNVVLDLLQKHNIDIKNCRAQTYDNASNMSGKYSGLQACIKEKNKLAHYVPCVGHSLNLVGECSVDECLDATNFFGVAQRLYVFFSASTHRWNVLLTNKSRVTNLSQTRWSCRGDATKLIVKDFNGIYKALEILAYDVNQKRETRQEALALLNNLIKIENVFMAILWNNIFQRFNATSQYLQKVNIDLISANNMLLSLVDFVKDLRDQFCDIEKDAKKLSTYINEEYSRSGKRKITRKLADKEVQVNSLSVTDDFRINTFYVIIDKLVSELQKRSGAYNDIINLFSFLTQLLFIENIELEAKATSLIIAYPDDLQSDLILELKQFIPRLKLQPKGFFSNRTEETDSKNDQILSPLQVVNWIVDMEMVEVFPNIYIAYRLLLTIPIVNCEAERSFSVLKRIKNIYRSTMLDERLSTLARLSIEVDLLRSINFNDLISNFARAKSRKKYF